MIEGKWQQEERRASPCHNNLHCAGVIGSAIQNKKEQVQHIFDPFLLSCPTWFSITHIFNTVGSVRLRFISIYVSWQVMIKCILPM